MRKFKAKISIFLLTIIFLIENCNGTAQKELEVVCSEETCKLPLCKCSDTARPAGIEFSDTPMMIGLTFSGVLKTGQADLLKNILNPVFKNPNGCPVQGTFFISNTGNGTSDYCLIQNLFNNNNEIAPSATKYACPYTDCESLGRYFGPWREDTADANIYEQKKNIATKARINRSFLRGFRVPFLDQRGSFHFKALKKYAFNYDSSALVKPDDIKKNKGFRLWPHTLDFPPSYSCPTCPTKKSYCKGSANCSMNALWIVPVHYLNPEGKNPCPSLIKEETPENILETRDCYKVKELTQKIIEAQLFENFDRHYKTNKAPFIINIELSWFDRHEEMLTKALVNFIEELTNPKKELGAHGDIYFVTLSKIVEWVQYPTPLNVIASKWLWDCDGQNYDYDEECEMIRRLRESSEELEERRRKNSTGLFDLKGEDLFRNGILTAVCLVFVFSTLFTIFYDKYN